MLEQMEEDSYYKFMESLKFKPTFLHFRFKLSDFHYLSTLPLINFRNTKS